jgi:hypothetical protein
MKDEKLLGYLEKQMEQAKRFRDKYEGSEKYVYFQGVLDGIRQVYFHAVCDSIKENPQLWTYGEERHDIHQR